MRLCSAFHCLRDRLGMENAINTMAEDGVDDSHALSTEKALPRHAL